MRVPAGDARGSGTLSQWTWACGAHDATAYNQKHVASTRSHVRASALLTAPAALVSADHGSRSASVHCTRAAADPPPAPSCEAAGCSCAGGGRHKGACMQAPRALRARGAGFGMPQGGGCASSAGRRRAAVLWQSWWGDLSSVMRVDPDFEVDTAAPACSKASPSSPCGDADQPHGYSTQPQAHHRRTQVTS